MTDREALTAALETVPNPALNWRAPIYEAARERLAQLPPYPAELVEQIVQKIDRDHSWYRCTGNHDYPALVRAVLDALNGETP